MKITNKVNDPNYIQWVEKFVTQIIRESKLSCKEIIIDDIEDSKRIYLIVDGEEYAIRTWNFHSVKKDEKDRTCAEMVDYSLVSAQCQGGFKIRPSKYIMIARKRERFAPLIKARSKRFTIIPRSNHYESKRCKKIRADQTHHGMPTQWAFRLPVVPGSGD